MHAHVHPGRRGFARAAGLGLLLALALLATAATADAAVRHPRVDLSFGADGTSATTIQEVDSLAYDQATDRLYALSFGHSVYAFQIAGNGTPTPVAGFPFKVSAHYGFPQIAVDNSATASAGHILYSFDGASVFGYDATGSPLGGAFPFKPPGEETCGVAVDSAGHIWVGDYSQGAVLEYEADGTGPAIRTVDTSAQGSPCNVEIDRSDNDLYVGTYGSGTWRYTAASGYAPSSATRYDERREPRIAVNPTRGVLYDGAEHTVRAFSTGSAALLEEFGNPTGEVKGVAVEQSSDTVFVANRATNQIEEWRSADVPLVTTNAPAGNSTVAGKVQLDGAGNVLECYFEYGPSAEYGQRQKCSPEAPYTADQTVTAQLPGLIGDQTYHYRLVAVNANGPGIGADQTITPHNVDGLQTEPASAIARTTATLNGSFNGTNEKTQYYFEYGPTTAYGSETATAEAGTTNGATPIATGVTGLTAGTTYHFRAVAINPKGKSLGADETFETATPVNGLRTTPATEIGATTATLNGELDPDGSATTFYFQYGQTTNYGETVPAPPGQAVGTTAPGEVAVSARPTDLEPGVTYHFRIVAANSFGTTVAGDDQTFATRQAPAIETFFSSGVTATSAVLQARINPEGDETTYYFEYGPTSNYGSTVPVPAKALPAGSAGVPVSELIEGLRGVTYHFRVVAKNGFGTTTSGDQTFTFFPPECPNSNIRQLTGGSFLPDCRAYELVSPPEVGGVLLSDEGPSSAYATTPSRFAFSGQFGSIEGTGEPEGVYADLYVATRTATGWVTRYTGVPGDQGTQTQGPPNIRSATNGQYVSLGIDEVMNWDTGQQGFVCCGKEGSYAPYLWAADGSSLGRLPSNIGQIPNGFADASKGGFFGAVQPSPDFSHYFFSSNNVAFAPGALTTAPGAAYDDNRATGEVSVVSVTPQNEPIRQDPGLASPSTKEYIKFPAVSTDGSHILMSTEAANGETHLYMRVNDSVSYDVSRGQDGTNHGVTFEGMSANGEKVYFTSTEQLTGDDHDSSRDLYMWSEKPTPTLTRISAGSGGTGNRDDCNASWTSGCGVSVVNIYNRPSCCNVPRPTDNAVAADSGEIYFYSPELLDNGRGSFGARNLYVYREGRPIFVATFGENKQVDRIQVTPDGTFAAFLTTQNLTSYNSAGHEEMYRYEPGAQTFECVSCIPNGEAPSGEVQGSENGIFMTNDGRVFFSTTDSLVPKDTDGLIDTYEYVDDRPQLISTGTSEADQGHFSPTGFIGVSANGTDVYFTTLDTLVGQDLNGAFYKFYDARTNGGFPYVQPQAPCEAADECHGPGSSPPPAAEEGSAAQLGTGGNVHHRHHKKHKRHRKHAGHGKKGKKGKKQAAAGHQKKHRGGGR